VFIEHLLNKSTKIKDEINVKRSFYTLNILNSQILKWFYLNMFNNCSKKLVNIFLIPRVKSTGKRPSMVEKVEKHTINHFPLSNYYIIDAP
jgi:hypothetical protein